MTVQITHRYEERDGKGETIAHVEVKDVGGVLWLTNLWVDPERRKQGRAVRLMLCAVGEWCQRDLYLSVEPYTDQPLDGEHLSQFYQSFGFRPTDVPGVLRRRAGVWAGREEAA